MSFYRAKETLQMADHLQRTLKMSSHLSVLFFPCITLLLKVTTATDVDACAY